MHLQESGEMYLETIFVLSERSKNVRSIDVCEEMGFSKPSVSRAMSILRNAGYVTMDDQGFLHLTESGYEVASKTYERHKVLTQCFVALGVPKEIAEEDACKIEHDISDETFSAIKRHMGVE